MSSLFRTGILGGMFVLCTTGVFWTSITACESLSQTSPLPPTDASDLDAGQPPEEPDESASSSSSGGSSSGDTQAPPNSARVRLSNLLQGPDAIDLCASLDGKTWQNGLITVNPAHPEAAKAEGLKFGETSQSAYVALASAAGSKYLFRVVPPNTDCNADPSSYTATSTAVSLRPGSGVTVIATGKIEDGVDAGDAAPKTGTMTDAIPAPATAALFRVVHGVPDIAAFDVVVNGETLTTGVRYGNAIGYPYTSSTGYATVPAGIPEDSTLTLRSGTTVRSFTIPERLRRGIAWTVFVGGNADKLTVNLCSDRTPDDGDVADCKKLAAQQ